MSELDFPAIAEPATEVLDAAPAKPAATESVPAMIRRTTLAELTAVDRGIAALKAAHGAIDYDITTPKGLQTAKDHRIAVRDARYKVPHIVKARKAELKDVSEALESEAERITAALLAIEKPHDDAIKAREKVLADEKAERERLAAERAAKFEAEIAGLRSWFTRCQAPGMTAERIANGITMLSEFTFPAETWAEFSVPAANAQCETLEAMRVLHAQVLAREVEAARLEAQRVENERIAAEQAAERKRLADAAAELARLQREAAENVARIQRLQARIAEIHAAATGFESAGSWTLFDAIVSVEALDVTANQYGELAPLAMAAQAGTLATLRGLYAAAVAREDAARDARIAAEKQAEEAARLAGIAAAEGMARAATDPKPGLNAPAAQGGVAQNPIQSQPADLPGDVAADGGAGAESVLPAAPAASSVTGPDPDLPPDPLDSEGGMTDIAPAAVDLLGDAVAPAADPVDAYEALAQCREALTDALELLEGWIMTKCPRKFIPEHMAHVAALRVKGGL